MAADLPDNLHYSADHEWVRQAGTGVVRVGITEYAAEQLGDIVYVTAPDEGQQVTRGEACGELESTKSVSDLISPVSGVVTAVNATVTAEPGVINSDSYGDGWLFEVETSAEDPLDGLLDPDGYAELIG